VSLTTAKRGADGAGKFSGKFNKKTGRITWAKSTLLFEKKWNIAGETWARDLGATASAGAVQISGVFTKPGSRTLLAFVYYYDKAAKAWIGINLDFNSIFTRTCDDDTDFDSFTPGDPGNPLCTMGATNVYYRRKQCRFCKNVRKQEMKSVRPCKCRPQDFKCNYGFYRTSKGNLDNPNGIDDPMASCEQDSDVFRDMCKESGDMDMAFASKIPGNQCTGGVDLAIKKRTSCDGVAPAPAPPVTVAPSNNFDCATASSCAECVKSKCTFSGAGAGRGSGTCGAATAPDHAAPYKCGPFQSTCCAAIILGQNNLAVTCPQLHNYAASGNRARTLRKEMRIVGANADANARKLGDNACSDYYLKQEGDFNALYCKHYEFKCPKPDAKLQTTTGYATVPAGASGADASNPTSGKGDGGKDGSNSAPIIIAVIVIVLGAVGVGVFVMMKNKKSGGLSISAGGTKYQPVGDELDDDELGE